MFGRFRRERAEDISHIARASSFDDSIAAERGRQVAVRNIIEDPEKRKEMESIFGVGYCKARYPEAYVKGSWKDLLKFGPMMGTPPKSS